jgi:hypothetical protein
MSPRAATVLAAAASLAACASVKREAGGAAALRAEAVAAYQAGKYGGCAASFARMGALGQLTRDDRYDAACCLALAGDRGQALATLQEVMAAGYRDAAHLQEDPDLAGLHGDPPWQGLVARAVANQRRYLASIDPELERLYRDDQADREGDFDRIAWMEVRKRDAARRARVDQILARGGVRGADDYFHAAMVFQHGDHAASYRRARELALQAVALEPDHHGARWLAAAARDRELMELGKPQLYGTQFRRQGNGPWQLYPVDPSVTDEERARWDVPPLAEARKRAERMNAAAHGPPR